MPDAVKSHHWPDLEFLALREKEREREVVRVTGNHVVVRGRVERLNPLVLALTESGNVDAERSSC